MTLGRCVFLVKQLLRYFWTITRVLACEYVLVITLYEQDRLARARLLISVHAFLHQQSRGCRFQLATEGGPARLAGDCTATCSRSVISSKRSQPCSM